MSIFKSLFGSTDQQEEVNNSYQSWRDSNPDNPSDDDFYQDTWNDLPDGAKDYLLDNTTFTDYSTGEECSTREKRGFLGLW